MAKLSNVEIASEILLALGLSPHGCYVVEQQHQEVDQATGYVKKWTTRHDVTRAEHLARVFEASGLFVAESQPLGEKGPK